MDKNRAIELMKAMGKYGIDNKWMSGAEGWILGDDGAAMDLNKFRDMMLEDEEACSSAGDVSDGETKPREDSKEEEAPAGRRPTHEMTDDSLETEIGGVMCEGVRDDKGMDRAKDVLAELLIRAWRRGVEEGKKGVGV